MNLNSIELDQYGHLGELLLAYALDLGAGIFLLAVGWIAAGWAQRIVLRLLDRAPRMDRTLRPVIASVVRYAILVLVVVAVLAQFGVQTASIIAILGAAGIAVGLALQGTLQNIAAGMMILFLRPFQVGEDIDAEGLDGTVVEIGLFLTQLTTFDGLYRSVPNAKLWNAAIVNYSRMPTRRLDLQVGISYDDDLAKAQTHLLGLLESDTRVQDTPAPRVLVAGLADSAVELKLRCWCSRGDYWDLRFDLTKTVKLALDDGGFTIPYPQHDVHVVSETGGHGAPQTVSPAAND